MSGHDADAVEHESLVTARSGERGEYGPRPQRSGPRQVTAQPRPVDAQRPTMLVHPAADPEHFSGDAVASDQHPIGLQRLRHRRIETVSCRERGAQLAGERLGVQPSHGCSLRFVEPAINRNLVHVLDSIAYATNVKKQNFWRRPAVCLGVAALVIGTGGAVALVGNDFRYTENAVTIPLPDGGSLAGVLTEPKHGAPRGLVVMVHGDGPVTATQDGHYNPWFEAAADAGFATVSWGKPGIEGSSGNWLAQTMSDRADEVSTVIDWAVQRRGSEADRIVLWGASQAGWVLPKVMADRTDIDGVVAVGTAINWLDQGRFNLLAELEAANATETEREAAIATSDRDRDLLAADAEFVTYAAETSDAEPMSAERWGFVRRNFAADATADLSRAAPRRIPVMLMAGTHDRNVDVDETARLYRDLLGDAVTVRHFDAVHSLARPAVDDSEAWGIVVGVFWPRALLAPGVTDAYAEFLRAR